MLDKQIPIIHSNGLNKDRLFQDNNDITFALNAITSNHEGGRREYQSEPGNILSVTLPSGYTVIGSIFGQNDEIYIFSTNNSNSEIGLYKQDTYTTLANVNLGFSTEHPITGEYRVRNGCEKIIYWCDGFNPDRWFNVSKPNDFKTSGVFDPNKFKFVPDITCPKIDLVKVNNDGGNLPLGSYYFQVEILDENENTIYRTDISPQTIIYNEDQSDAYNNIDGGLNAPQYDPAIGGLPATNKSITLKLYNLDTSFDYIRVNVIRQITGLQTVDAHSVGQLIPISSSEIQWTYTGYNTSSGDFPVDYSSLIIPDVKYTSSYVQEQVQGRLVRANVQQDLADYSEFQSYASKITAQWVAKEIETADQFALGNPKNPNTYWECTSFQGDEIYAFGIQYLLKNGDWSPVFHIPGRHSNGSDLDTITVVSNATVSPTSTQVWLSDVEHLGYTVGQTLPRWKAFNTASITTSNTTSHPYDYVGEFGYYESSLTYPDIRKCNNSYIWGEDAGLNQINPSTKIRHHRFPDRRLIPHVDGTNGEYLVPLGVKFDNIDYPSTDVIGHRFCHAVRNTSDKTVVDSGWGVQPTYAVTGVGNRVTLDANFADFNVAFTNNLMRYNSANIFFNQTIHNPDYIKLNTAYHIESFADSEATVVNKNATDTITAYSYLFLTTDKAVPDRSNYKVENQVFVPAGSYTSSSVFGVPIQSTDNSADDNLIRLTYDLAPLTSILPAQVLGGANITDPVTGTLKYNNHYVYKKVNIEPYNALLNLQYNYLNFNYATLADSNEFYNGDTIISLSSVTRTFWPIFTPDNILQGLCYSTLYEEHDFNPYMRYSGTGDANKYYRPGSDINILIEKVAYKNTDGYYTLRENMFKEYFAYNKDYTVQSTEQGKVSLPLGYDYCSDCRTSYPNRIIFSPKSFDEETFDLYRINKINDYIDLPAHRGQITGLKYQNNQLLVHTEDTTFILQPNPQQIATDQNTAYLTTGDFLSIPPQELIQTDVGTAGLQSKQAMCNTPFGHCWIDQKRGEIFKFDRSLEIMSNQGLLQWFKENLPSEATQKFFEIEGLDFPIQSTYDLRGVGICMYYDPRFKRLLISKKDYLPINQRQEFVIENGDYISVFSLDDRLWQGSTLEMDIISINPDNPLYFQDKSWTISYSFLDDSFTSWHSYIPAHGFSDSNSYYTSRLDNKIWKHLSKERYQNYYNNKYDFIIEWSNIDPVSSTVNSLYYVGYSQVWDDLNKRFKTVDTTFDRGMLYNFEQSTGLQTLILQNQHTNPYQNVSLPNTSKYVIRTDQNYKIAGLVDMAINQPVVTKDWTYTKLYPGYIDLVPYTPNINSSKSPYDMGSLWDKFVFARLFYKPSQDHKIAVIMQVLNSQQSIR